MIIAVDLLSVQSVRWSFFLKPIPSSLVQLIFKHTLNGPCLRQKLNLINRERPSWWRIIYFPTCIGTAQDIKWIKTMLVVSPFI